MPPRFIEYGEVEWDEYATLFVKRGRGYTWCFSGLWSRCDNHHYGAAARIRYLLDKGSAPTGYNSPEARFLPRYAPYRIDHKAPANA